MCGLIGLASKILKFLKATTVNNIDIANMIYLSYHMMMGKLKDI